MNNVKIFGINKAKLLKALYDATGNGEMSIEEASDLVSEQLFFYTLKGVDLKIDISNNTFDAYLYNQMYGHNAAQKAIESLTQKIVSYE